MFTKIENRKSEGNSEIGCGDFARSAKNVRRTPYKKPPSRSYTRKSESLTGSFGTGTPRTPVTRSAGMKSCSKSMTDLRLGKMEKEPSGSRRRKIYTPSNSKAEIVTSSKALAPTETTECLDRPNVTDAGRRVQNVLMLHAWRRRREEHKEMQANVEAVTSQVDGLQMQIYVLRQLLETEKSRVAVANEEARKALNSLEECAQEKCMILKEKETLELRIKDLELRIAELENQCRNQINELKTVISESQNWEKQLGKEREKLKKVEEERRALKEEVQFRENLLMLQTRSVEQLSQSNKDLQDRLDAQVPLWDDAMAQVDSAHEKLKKSEEVQWQQEVELREKEEEIRELTAKVEDLERRVKEQDERNGDLGKCIMEKNEELAIVKQKLGELSEIERTWSGRAVKVATVCAKVPAACFYTLAILLMPRAPFKGF